MACDAGQASACGALGLATHRGEGVPRDLMLSAGLKLPRLLCSGKAYHVA